MDETKHVVIFGLSLVIAAGLLGSQLSGAALDFKAQDRTVTVKGLAEREVPADIAIWPISFQDASDDLNALYKSLDQKTGIVREFLKSRGFSADEISIAPPSVNDLQARGYGHQESRFRYTATAIVTLYSKQVDKVRAAMSDALELGRLGVAVTGENYQARPEFLFTQLNAIKPKMIEQATRNAREAGEKFADDSGSELGKIRRAQQGLFTISDRDSTTPYIKQVRVVSTIEYTLID